MAPSIYRGLDASKKEIRVLHLQPGGRDDPIRVAIEHVQSDPSEDDEPWKASKQHIQELHRNLPETWAVHRTLEGQPIFQSWTSGGDVYTNHVATPKN